MLAAAACFLLNARMAVALLPTPCPGIQSFPDSSPLWVALQKVNTRTGAVQEIAFEIRGVICVL